MTRQLSESLEDYLEAIAELIVIEGHAHSKEIAKKLNVTMPSVTGALRQLVEMGYIVYNTHYPVQLTASGKQIADRVIHRHKVLKTFFAEILGLKGVQASETACHLEHVVDEDTIRRFVIFSEAIENRIDARALQTYLTEAMDNLNRENSEEYCVLSDLSAEESAVVERMGRNLAGMEKIEISEGDFLVVSGISLDKSKIRVTCAGKNLEIPLAVAENIWMKRG